MGVRKLLKDSNQEPEDGHIFTVEAPVPPLGGTPQVGVHGLEQA